MIITTYAFNGAPFMAEDRICLESDTYGGFTNRYEFDFAHYFDDGPNDPMEQADDFDYHGFNIIGENFYPSRVRVLPPGHTLIDMTGLRHPPTTDIKTGDILIFESKRGNILAEVQAEHVIHPATGLLTVINDDFELHFTSKPGATENLLGIR